MNIHFSGACFSTSNNLNHSITFSSADRVQDELRGWLYYTKDWIFVGINQIKKPKIFKRLALVLESPHKDEYDINNNPLRPANGRTGIKINQKLATRKNLTSLLNKKQIYEVFLMNPVQFQASCYSILSNKCTRNNTEQVFRVLFNRTKGNQRQDFIDRLKQYAPDIIFNCCTNKLKEIVRNAIQEYKNKSNITICEDKHPSTW